MRRVHEKLVATKYLATLLLAIHAPQVAFSQTSEDSSAVPSSSAKIAEESENNSGSGDSTDASTKDANEESKRYRLVYHFRENQVLRYEVRYQSLMEVQKGNAKQTINDRTLTEKHLRVKSVGSDGAAVLEPVIDRVRMKVRFDDAKPITFDSREPGDAPKQFKDIHKNVGRATARMTISVNGEMLEAVRLDENGEPVRIEKKSDENKASAETSDEISANENMLALLPKEPIAVGDSWKERFPVRVKVDRNIERTAILQRRYELEKVEGSLATIRVHMAIITPIADPAILAQLIQRTPSGTILFDMEHGRILNRTLKQDRSVFGAIGPMSSMRAASKLKEEYISPVESVRAENGSRS